MSFKDYFDYALLGPAVKRRLMAGLRINGTGMDDSTKGLLESVKNDFREQFNVDIDLIRKVNLCLDVRRYILPVYIRILRKASPKAAVIVCSYGKETFIEACKMLGIPVVELQHGVIGSHHMGYSFPGNRTKRCFPDYLFVFGDFWRHGVAFPIDDSGILSVGYPYFESERARYRGCRRKGQVLFISQGTIGIQGPGGGRPNCAL